MPTLAELNEKIEAKGKQLAELFKPFPDMTEDQVKQARALNDELADLGKSRDELVALESMKSANDRRLAELNQPAGRRIPAGGGKGEREERQERKSPGQILIESEQYKNRSRKGFAPITVSLKALLDTTGAPIPEFRLPRVEPGATRMEHVADLLPEGETDANSITYLEETTTTNAAATVAEGAAKPESTLAFTERTIAIRKIATLLPVTDELFNDAPALRSYVEARLALFVRLTEDTQLVSGDGNAPNIRGLLNFTGVQTQAKGADPTPDAVYKAMTKIRVNAFLPPDGVIFHPNDWQDIRLLRTTDGIYIWGSPAEAGPERIWGLNIVQTTAMTENTALVGAFRYATQVWRRDEVTVDASDSHEDFFARNQLMLRAEERLGLAVYRPSALCTVTGI
jgi:HK97 family phage major capsid protein